MIFQTEEEYLTHLRSQSQFPKGFSYTSYFLSFVPEERPQGRPYRMDGSIVYLDEPTTSFASISTKNALPGASVQLLRKRMEEKQWRALHVNNCLSNVLVANGYADALAITEEVAHAVQARPEECLSVSTGIIGWRLPIQQICSHIHSIDLKNQHDALMFAESICTTDRYPKLLRHQFDDGSSICMVAKGAGMIEPNMATMLAFIFTDCAFSRAEMQAMLERISKDSFNAISVDSDTSTSDMVVFLSSNQYKSKNPKEFEATLHSMATTMAMNIVRNGEGTSHVIKVETVGAPSYEFASKISRSVANSPLVKSALYGNDPNVGRILMAIGKAAVDGCSLENLKVVIGGELVYADKRIILNNAIEQKLSMYFKDSQFDPYERFPSDNRHIHVHIDLAAGTECASIFGSDLSKEYVLINAEYRS